MLNTLILMSDEHNPKVSGCYGHPIVQTPHIDALAAQGVRFSGAYCNSPICVPSRASLHTGCHVHDIGYWDNAMPYDGAVQGWGHALQAAGRPVVSIGKLHFRRAGDPNGFDDEILPIYVKDGVGDVTTLLRRDPIRRPDTPSMAGDAGPGNSPYWAYDCDVAERAARWLHEEGRAQSGWTLFVSFVMPHFPLTAPAEFFALYPPDTLPMPKCGKDYVPENATLARMRDVMDFHRHFPDDDAVRRAVAGYFGIVSALDHNVGRVLGALAGAGLGDNTRIIYTSDHGDNVGARGFWGKSTMWQESAGVPLVIAGPGIPQATVCNTPASLLDLHATVVSWAGVPDIDDGRHRPGRDLLELSRGADPDRAVMSQYHAVGAPTGIFMLRWGIWKLIECFGDAPILYDLAADPEEMTNLAADPAHAADLAACRAKLAEFGDIAEINARAFADQAAMIDRVGGEAAIRATTPIAYTAPPGPGAA